MRPLEVEASAAGAPEADTLIQGCTFVAVSGSGAAAQFAVDGGVCNFINNTGSLNRLAAAARNG